MPAKIVDNEVIIDNLSEASSIYQKGYFGVPSHGKLKLNLIEALFLLEMEKLEIEENGNSLAISELMERAVKDYPEFEIRYLVFKDLRNRGYVVRIGGKFGFEVYSRGTNPPQKPRYYAKAISEREIFSIEEAIDWIQIAGKNKKKLMLGLVDEEGDLTYYFIKFFHPWGKIEEGEISGGEAVLLEDRAMVWDEKFSNELKKEFFGRDFDGAVQLSLLETLYLMKKGMKLKKDGKKLSLRSFKKYAKKVQPDLYPRFKAYKNLKEKGMIAKTGFKFGSHFRVYRDELPGSHAPYLVHVVPKDFKSTWTEISRGVRLAHSVRKQILFAKVDKEISYIRIKRTRP